jgi:hypothetical protein
MVSLFPLLIRGARRNLGLAAATFCVVCIAHFQAIAAAADPPIGRLDFEAANLPTANLEVDLSQAMFKDLFGIGDAAIAGIAETVLKASQDGTGAHKQTRIAGEQLEAARQIVQLVSNVVREVRVRAYESLPEGVDDAQGLFKPFDAQLKAANWETLVRVRQEDQVGRISVLRHDGAVQGLFVVGTDGDSAVILNVVCDISPENVKKLAAAATKIGLEANFQPKFQLKMSHHPAGAKSHSTVVIQNQSSATPPVPPKPPTPPTPPAPIVK